MGALKYTEGGSRFAFATCCDASPSKYAQLIDTARHLNLRMTLTKPLHKTNTRTPSPLPAWKQQPLISHYTRVLVHLHVSCFLIDTPRSPLAANPSWGESVVGRMTPSKPSGANRSRRESVAGRTHPSTPSGANPSRRESVAGRTHPSTPSRLKISRCHRRFLRRRFCFRFLAPPLRCAGPVGVVPEVETLSLSQCELVHFPLNEHVQPSTFALFSPGDSPAGASALATLVKLSGFDESHF